MGMFWGCSTVRHRFDTTAINNIELGKTTGSEVIAMLGAPRLGKIKDNAIVSYSYAYGYQDYLAANSSVDYLQIQLFNGVVINKSQTLSHFN